jgi:hypothetical protein
MRHRSSASAWLASIKRFGVAGSVMGFGKAGSIKNFGEADRSGALGRGGIDDWASMRGLR